MSVNIDNLTLFLSRLCGGELLRIFGLVFYRFLSRLCGGERVDILVNFPLGFLSRLCGGELKKEIL